MNLTSIYYLLKPLIPRGVQIALRREVIRRKLPHIKNIWPINESAANPPEGWRGWPEGKKFALVITHDVDTQLGHDKCGQLADLDEDMGFRSSFNFVAEDYPVSSELLKNLSSRGFEIGSHGIHHTNPFRTSEYFQKQASQINRYLKAWDAVGFRSPSMFYNSELLHDLNIEYDASTFDTDPFEPQPEGVETIFPFFVPCNSQRKGYVELPYTLPQDFFCFILMRHQDINLWKQKLDWIAERGGMALFIAHPDYMNFDGIRRSITEYPADYYRDFVAYIKEKYRDQYWHALPREMACFWSNDYNIKKQTVLAREEKLPHRSAQPSGEVIDIDPSQDPRWDEFVKGHPFGLICHLSGWRQVLEESFPHMKGHYLALLNQDNSIRAALPVFEVRSILTGNRLVSIPFATNCDPLISSHEDMRELLDAAINLSTKLRCSKIEIRTLLSSPLISDDRIGSVVYYKSHKLSLEAGPEEIKKTCRIQLRQRINKSMKNGLVLQTAKDETELNEFYHLYVKSRKVLGLPPQPYNFFRSLWKTFLSSRHFTLLLVRHESRLIAGLIIFKFKDRCSCEYMGTAESSKNLNAGHFLFWEAIKSAYSEGYKLFDFGRTGINNEGLMTYKSHWGTEAIDLPQFYYPKEQCSRLISTDATMTYQLIRKISKNVPDPVFQMMGNFLYRHLG